MTAPSITAIMDGIETRLNTIVSDPQLRVSDIRPGQVQPPIAVVGIPPISDYWTAMKRGAFEIEPTITVLVSASIDRPGQRLLASFANPTGAASIVAAINSDPTLGGIVGGCYVRDFRPLGIEEVGVIGYWGGIFTMYVAAEGGT